MSLYNVIATIYADKREQLEAIGFNESQITYSPSFKISPTLLAPEHWEVSLDCGLEGTDDVMPTAMRFLSKAKTSKGRNKAGLDTDISYRCYYSPCYD